MSWATRRRGHLTLFFIDANVDETQYWERFKNDANVSISRWLTSFQTGENYNFYHSTGRLSTVLAKLLLKPVSPLVGRVRA